MAERRGDQKGEPTRRGAREHRKVPLLHQVLLGLVLGVALWLLSLALELYL